MKTLNVNLPTRAVLVCSASEYPKMVALLEEQGKNLKGRRLIETSHPLEQVIKMIQELVDELRVTDFFVSTSAPEALYVQILGLCKVNKFSCTEINPND